MSLPDSEIVRRGVVAVIEQDNRLLVIRRSQHVLAPRLYCFPGGGIEEAESEEAALVRELQEELNVTVRPVRCIWQNVTSWRIALSWWLAEMHADQTPTPNPAEVESIHWHTLEEMAALPDLLQSNAEFLKLLRQGKIRLQ